MDSAQPGKTLALVTCLYDLVKRGSAQHRTVDWMLANDDFVLSQDRELVIFTEPELEAEIARRRGARPTKIIAIPFEELIGRVRVLASERGALQDNASRWKVTPVYVQLMWAKYAMLDRALEVTRTSHLGWIDLGISHVGKPPSDGRDVFADPSDRVRVHVLRCFGKRDVDHPNYWRSVQGHLAGGLLVGNHDRIRALVADFWRAVDLATSRGLAPSTKDYFPTSSGNVLQTSRIATVTTRTSCTITTGRGRGKCIGSGSSRTHAAEDYQS